MKKIKQILADEKIRVTEEALDAIETYLKSIIDDYELKLETQDSKIENLESETEDIKTDCVYKIDALIDEYQREIAFSSGFDTQISAQKIIEDLKWLIKKVEE